MGIYNQKIDFKRKSVYTFFIIIVKNISNSNEKIVYIYVYISINKIILY